MHTTTSHMHAQHTRNSTHATIPGAHRQTDRQTDRFPLLCFSELLSSATGDPLAAIRAHEQVFETTTVTNTPARISRCTKDTSQTIFASRSHP
ncbi:hypothetical protein CF319_g4850 [Tilletia indica]|nr:hypothetical protein CF319_g4850 [Tilletia indica]